MNDLFIMRIVTVCVCLSIQTNNSILFFVDSSETDKASQKTYLCRKTSSQSYVHCFKYERSSTLSVRIQIKELISGFRERISLGFWGFNNSNIF